MNKNSNEVHSFKFIMKDTGQVFNLAIYDGDKWICCFDTIDSLEACLNECTTDKTKPDNFEIEYTY
jgi:hypothetical protein